MGSKPEARFRFIQERAEFAAADELDILLPDRGGSESHDLAVRERDAPVHARASSWLWVAISAARPDARTSASSASNT